MAKTIYNHSSNDRTPYTYLIGWSWLDTWYYGVRFGKGCYPDQLWVSYFTSSGFVKKFREEYGEPDVIEVRHIFKSKEAAQEWESKVIERMGAIWSDRWLNMSRAGKKFHNQGHTDASIEKMIRTHNLPENVARRKERNSTPESIAKRVAAAIEYNNRPEVKEWHREKMIEIWNRPGEREKRLARLKEVWSLQETKDKRRETDSTPETKERRSKSSKEKWDNIPGLREKHSEIIKEAMNRQEVKDKIKETRSDPERKKRRSDIAKETWTRQDVRKKRIESRKETESKPEVKKQRSDSAKECQNRPEVKEKTRQTKARNREIKERLLQENNQE